MSFPRYQVQFCETASQIPDDLWDACFLPPAEGRSLDEGLAHFTKAHPDEAHRQISIRFGKSGQHRPDQIIPSGKITLSPDKV
jgi:hypothetical protein